MSPDDQLVYLFLWLVAGLLLASMCLPPVLQLLGLSRYRIEEDEQAADLEPDEDDPYHARLRRQLTALGFRPLGAYTETVNFFAFHWVWSCRQRAYGSGERGAFAVVYTFVAGEPVRLAFATCFADGAMVWTGNHSEDIQMLAGDYVRWGQRTDDLAELLRLHHGCTTRWPSAWPAASAGRWLMTSWPT